MISPEHRRSPLLTSWICLLVLAGPLAFVAAQETVPIVNPSRPSADPIPVQRVALGEADDYKPCIARLPSGELLLSAFHQYKRDGGKVLEQTLLYRSVDGGKTWSPAEELALLGREPYLTVLTDGTIFLTGHLLAEDVRNEWGYTCGFLHRSTDGGRTWESLRIESEVIKPKASNHTTRNVLELTDGTLLLGVDYDGGGGPYFVWRSRDGGKTWDKTVRCEPHDFQSKYGFFGGETWLWQAKSGKIWALVRVDSGELPIQGRPIQAQNDQADHFILFSSRDEGRSFDRIRDFGDYGEMYMSLLRLQDERLLLTFTVRDLKPPLGVRALIGAESDDGFEFDFARDRIMLDTRTPVGKYQGGGFGPSVQLDDGTLVTAYSYRGEDNLTHLEVVRWKLGASQVSSTSGRPTSLIGYTEGRNDLPDGQFANWRTNRACIVRADGTGRRLVAEELASKDHAWTQFAGWSPTGERAVVLSLWESPENAAWERAHRTFRMTEGWLVDSCLMDLATGKLDNVTAIDRVSIYNTGLFFLPDGSGFGFTPLINGVSKPYVMDLDGRNKRDVSGMGGGFAYGYSASPDGKQIAYHENYQVFVSAVDGSNKRRIETGQPFNFVPQWSPDGEWLLFVSGEHYDCHPHVVRRDGTGLKKLAGRGGYRGVVEKLKHPDFHSESSDVPVWSKEGESVFYTAKIGESIELMRVSLDGKIDQLTRSSPGVRHYHPSPSPDGRWLLFGSDRSGIMQLYVSRTDGSDAEPVTNVSAGSAAMHGHWQPVK